MSSGLYGNIEIIERTYASPSAGPLTGLLLVPCDLEVIGAALYLGTAPTATDGLIFNGSVVPTSQVTSVPAGASNQNGVTSTTSAATATTAGTTQGSYTLWTYGNAPTVLGTAKTNLTFTDTALVQNSPYALNYPFPGPSGTLGYKTAQQTGNPAAETPVTAPPTVYAFAAGGLVAPDNTYTDLNGFIHQANILHAGDVVTFTVLGGGTNLSVGASAALQVSFFCNKN